MRKLDNLAKKCAAIWTRKGVSFVKLTATESDGGKGFLIGEKTRVLED